MDTRSCHICHLYSISYIIIYCHLNALREWRGGGAWVFWCFCLVLTLFLQTLQFYFHMPMPGTTLLHRGPVTSQASNSHQWLDYHLMLWDDILELIRGSAKFKTCKYVTHGNYWLHFSCMTMGRRALTAMDLPRISSLSFSLLCCKLGAPC